MIRRRAVVRGTVQGVFFRANTEVQATDHGVAGWVRNDPDGTETAELEGEPEAVEAVIAWFRDGGPPRGSVESVDVTALEPTRDAGFEVRG